MTKPFFERAKVGWILEAPEHVPCAARVELYWCVRRGYTVPGHDQALNHPLHVLEGSQLWLCPRSEKITFLRGGGSIVVGRTL